MTKVISDDKKNHSGDNDLLRHALRISAADLTEQQQRGAGLVAFADFLYVFAIGPPEEEAAVSSVRAEVEFTPESGLLRPWLRCSKCGQRFGHLYMASVSEPPRCAKCWSCE
jgi:hypothetical protein